MSTYTPSAEALAAARRMQQAVSDAGATMTLSSGDRSVTIGAVTPDAVSGHITDKPDGHPFVPPDEYFDTDEFLESRELELLGAALIARCPEFGFLTNANATIGYRWKRKGGSSHGARRFGKCQKPSGLLKHFSGCDYVIWLAADHCRDVRITNLRLESLLYHELMHCGYEIDEDETSATYGEMRLTIRGHDDELFWAELHRYGTLDLDPGANQRIVTANTFRQIALPAGEAS